MKYKLYEVGGRVRDEILGIESKDIDYTVVIEDIQEFEDPYDEFVKQIEEEGYDVFENKKSCFTVRSRFPAHSPHAGLTADFVLARKEVSYPPNSRVPVTEYGSLVDDLIRRDFTVNALAKDENGEIIDKFGGLEDLHYRILDTPTDTAVSFSKDPLRVLRAIRFAVTKDMLFADDIYYGIQMLPAHRMELVSIERARNELRKMFRHNTKRSFEMLGLLKELNSGIYDYLFDGRLWLEPTLKTK